MPVSVISVFIRFRGQAAIRVYKQELKGQLLPRMWSPRASCSHVQEHVETVTKSVE